MFKFLVSPFFAGLLIFSYSTKTIAQPANPRTLTNADYARAESMMAYNTSPLIDKASVRPNWLEGDRFWYRILTATGSEFILVDPAKKSRLPAFDHQKLAAALSAASGNRYQANSLPFSTISYTSDNSSVIFLLGNKKWAYDVQLNTCLPLPYLNSTDSKRVTNMRYMSMSPDGKKAVFIRDYNLWLHDVTTGAEKQLTTDGVKDFGYATDNAGWRKSNAAIVKWSPDSKKIATYQQDERKVSDMYLVTTNVGKPTLQAWKYPLPGDNNVAMLHRVIIEVDQPKVIRLAMEPDIHRSTLGDDIVANGNEFGDNEWRADGTTLAFVSTSRDHKNETLRIANAADGTVKTIFSESVATQFESGQGSINWKYLSATNEIIWYSERDDNGHLYLYDATTGKLKNQITKGNFAISEILKLDEKTRTVYFLAGGREEGRNPYFSHFYKINLDGKNLTLLTPEDGNHNITLSPGESYFIDSYSKQDVPPVIVLRNMNGQLVTNLEKTDISRLTATGWKPPTPITVKARDGQTDLYGLMFAPTNLDPTKKYPVVNYIYPGPQGGSISSWSFLPAVSDHQALAELGFIVIAIEGTCNPLRSKSFHDLCYGNMADNTLPDQISGIQQLAKKYSYIDVDRVGVWGHSGGGYATASAMFRYPDFYKVGISESGNHENRNYEDDWGERYIGLVKNNPDGTTNYDAQANQNFAKNLKGKLMLAHGMLDDNVPPYNTLLVVDALIKANKDFDLVIFPNSRHGYGEFSLYMTRRRWDYFVKNLAGNIPPAQYELKGKNDSRNVVN